MSPFCVRVKLSKTVKEFYDGRKANARINMKGKVKNSKLNMGELELCDVSMIVQYLCEWSIEKEQKEQILREMD